MQGTLTFATTPSFRIELNAAGELPKRIKVLAWGDNKGANGNFILNATSAALLPKNQRKLSFEQIAYDFEHNTVKGSPTYKGEPASIAGNGDVELVDGEGLFLNNIGYTDDGTKFIGGKHYMDVSPTLVTNAQREVIFIHSVGACRNGAIPGLTLSANSADFTQLTTNTTTMDPKALLCKLLSLPADSTDDAIQAAADKTTKPEAEGSEPQMNAANLEIAKLNGVVEKLTKVVEGIQTNSATTERSALISQAAREGKVIPASALTGDLQLNNAQLGALIKDLPATVPLDQRTSEVTPASATALQANSAEDAVRKQLGFTPEEWAKLGKAA